MTVVLAKDVQEIVRTWRGWVLGLAFVFTALTGPLLAKYMGELIAAFGSPSLGGEGGASVPVPMSQPDAVTFVSAHAQWVNDLQQTVALAVSLVAGSVFASEFHEGPYLFTLTRGVTRGAFIVSKTMALLGVAGALLASATATNAVVTRLLYGEVNLERLAAASALSFAGFAFIASIAAVVGAMTFSPVGAAASAIAAVLCLSVVGLWPPAARWSPAGLGAQASELVAGKPWESPWPLLSALVFTAVLLSAAVAVLKRREL